MKKNAWLAALLNILITGLGYVYVGKRIPFGIMLIFTNVFVCIWYFTTPDAMSVLTNIWMVVASITGTIAFAVDAFLLAKEVNK